MAEVETTVDYSKLPDEERIKKFREAIHIFISPVLTADETELVGNFHDGLTSSFQTQGTQEHKEAAENYANTFIELKYVEDWEKMKNIIKLTIQLSHTFLGATSLFDFPGSVDVNQ